MGLTYARSFRQYGLCNAEHLFLVEKDALRRSVEDLQQLGQILVGPEERLSHCDVVILAVKPQDFSALAASLAPLLKPGQVVLSIMAGITMERIRQQLRHDLVVRAMPNLAAKIGMGMTAFTALSEVDRHHLHLAETLLDTTGRSIYLEEERLLDAVPLLAEVGLLTFSLSFNKWCRLQPNLGWKNPPPGCWSNKPCWDLITYSIKARKGLMN